MHRLMQLVADDGVLCHEAGIAIHKNPYIKFPPSLGWAWEMGWKEAAYVAAQNTGAR
jgi:hypothetical protein